MSQVPSSGSPPAERRGPAPDPLCSVPSDPAGGAAELRSKPVFLQPDSQLAKSLY